MTLSFFFFLIYGSAPKSSFPMKKHIRGFQLTCSWSWGLVHGNHEPFFSHYTLWIASQLLWWCRCCQRM